MGRELGVVVGGADGVLEGGKEEGADEGEEEGLALDAPPDRADGAAVRASESDEISGAVGRRVL